MLPPAMVFPNEGLKEAVKHIFHVESPSLNFLYDETNIVDLKVDENNCVIVEPSSRTRILDGVMELAV